jgi:predicted GIY-YIG superfamily endonuclease
MDLLNVCGPCVYFLTLGNKIVYVGKTISLSKRLSDHKHGHGRPGGSGTFTSAKEFDDVFYISMRDSKIAGQVEYALIKFIRPIFNSEFDSRGRGCNGEYLSTGYIPIAKQFSTADAKLLSYLI